MVSSESRLVEVIGHISNEPRVAVDSESNGFFRYHERVCLVQLSSGDTAFLVDPFAIEDLRPLGELLGDLSVEKVFHAGDNDIRSFDRDWGFRVNNVFDTSIAASLVGSQQLSLQAVVEEYVGVKLEKRRNLQRSDWTKRPLSPESMTYAASDVLHLPKAREELLARLTELSRLSWAKEEFEHLESVRYTPPDRELAFFSIKGSRNLDGRGLAVLLALWQFREKEAKRLDRPVFKVMGDSVLVELASNPTAELSTIKGLGRFGRPPDDRVLRRAINTGVKSGPVTRPIRTLHRAPLSVADRERARDRLKTLKKWRGQLGQDLGLDPSLLWPAASLERLSQHPDSLQTELASTDVRNWQKGEFGSALKKVLTTLK